MDIKQLSRFCIDNAGQEASGEDRDGNKRKGRILAYTPSKSGGWIILEDRQLGKKKLPTPLPSMPYLDNKWYCVVGDCHLGVACLAGTVKLVSIPNRNPAIKAAAPTPVVAQAPVNVNTIPRKCGHCECHDDWCWKRYIGEV